MRVSQIRLENFRTLIAEVGGISKMADYLDRSPSQISHLGNRNPVKRIGHQMAAHIEKTFGKPEGWLDQIHQDNKKKG